MYSNEALFPNNFLDLLLKGEVNISRSSDMVVCSIDATIVVTEYITW